MAENKGDALHRDEKDPQSPSTSAAKPVTIDDDSDPDFDDLDGMCVVHIHSILQTHLFVAAQMSSISSPPLTINLNHSQMYSLNSPYLCLLDPGDLHPPRKPRPPPLLP
jgi:hypothetical protein